MRVRKLVMRDAKKRLWIYVIKEDIANARRDKKRGLPPQISCVIAHAGRRLAHVSAINVQANFTRIWWHFKTLTVVERYKNGPSARITAKAWDEWNGSEPGRIELLPPTGVRTLKHLRSKEMKAKREASKRKRIEEGTPPRPYVKVNRKLRWGLGKHDAIA